MPAPSYYWIDEDPEPIKVTLNEYREMQDQEEFTIAIHRNPMGAVVTNTYGERWNYSLHLTDREIIAAEWLKYSGKELGE